MIIAAVSLVQSILGDQSLLVPSNTYLPISGHVAAFEGEVYFLETIELCLGKNIEKPLNQQGDCENVKFVMDLGKRSIILPNALIYDQHTFGYFCNPQMSCHQQSFLYYCSYNTTYAVCHPAQVPVRFGPGDTFLNNDMPRMNFSFVNDTFQWELGTFGILGMSPESSFWRYVRQNIKSGTQGKQNIQFALGYNFTNHEQAYRLDKLMLHSSGWFINSKQVKDDGILVSLPANSTVWTIPQIEVVRFSGDTPGNHDACVSNVMNKFLYIENFTSLLKPRILKQLCGNEQVCFEKNSVLGDVDNIYLTLYKPGNDESRVKVILDPFDFIMFDENDKAVLGIGDVNEDKTNQCPQNTSLILGRLFFSKVWLIIQLNEDESFHIGLHQQPSDYHIFFFMAFLVIFHLLMIYLSLLVIRTYSRNTKQYIEFKYRQIIEGYLNSYDKEQFERMLLEKSSPQFNLQSFTRTFNHNRGTF